MDAKLTTQCPVSMSHHHGHGYDVIYLHSPVTQDTGPSSRGEITKNNKCGSIIKDDNFMITCADRST